MSYCPKFNARGKGSKIQDVDSMHGIHQETLTGLGPASRVQNWGKKTGSPHAAADELLTRPNLSDQAALMKGSLLYG